MTLSELIRQLQDALQKYGDVKVGCWGCPEIEDPEPMFCDDLNMYVL